MHANTVKGRFCSTRVGFTPPPPGWTPGATFYLLVRVVIMQKTVLLIITLIAIMWGCSSVIGNSEGFYKDRPRRPINWREYMTD
jgi:hypothetical protein